MEVARTGLVLSLAFAVLALGSAYVMQYGFDLQPCRLCYWQRYPYMAIVAVAAIGLVTGRSTIALALVVLLFAVDAGIALYHTGIEQGIFVLPEGCAAEAEMSMESMMQSLGETPARCDQPAFVWLGLSLSAWNALAAAAMTVVPFVMLLRARR